MSENELPDEAGSEELPNDLMEDIANLEDPDTIDSVIEAASQPQEIHISSENIDIVTDPDSDLNSNQNNDNELSNKIMDQFGDLQSQIWDKLQEDRALIDRFIDLFTDRITDSESVKSVYVEAITSLLNTKATTAMNSTKLLDSQARMISAIKNMNTNNSTIDLTALLSSDGPMEAIDPDAP